MNPLQKQASSLMQEIERRDLVEVFEKFTSSFGLWNRLSPYIHHTLFDTSNDTDESSLRLFIKRATEFLKRKINENKMIFEETIQNEGPVLAMFQEGPKDVQVGLDVLFERFKIFHRDTIRREKGLLKNGPRRGNPIMDSLKAFMTVSFKTKDVVFETIWPTFMNVLDKVGDVTKEASVQVFSVVSTGFNMIYDGLAGLLESFSTTIIPFVKSNALLFLSTIGSALFKLSMIAFEALNSIVTSTVNAGLSSLAGLAIPIVGLILTLSNVSSSTQK
jgi:hypothetical protein